MHHWTDLPPRMAWAGRVPKPATAQGRPQGGGPTGSPRRRRRPRLGEPGGGRRAKPGRPVGEVEMAPSRRPSGSRCPRTAPCPHRRLSRTLHIDPRNGAAKANTPHVGRHQPVAALVGFGTATAGGVSAGPPIESRRNRESPKAKIPPSEATMSSRGRTGGDESSTGPFSATADMFAGEPGVTKGSTRPRG